MLLNPNSIGFPFAGGKSDVAEWQDSREISSQRFESGSMDRQCKQRFSDPCEFRLECGGIGKLMFPHADHRPPPGAQFSTDGSVPFSVPVDFHDPIIPVRLRDSAVSWATMPEAPVNKQRNPSPWKHEIWLATDRIFPSPTDQTRFLQNLRHSCFRGSIAMGFHLGHDLGPSSRADIIHLLHLSDLPGFG